MAENAFVTPEELDRNSVSINHAIECNLVGQLVYLPDCVPDMSVERPGDLVLVNTGLPTDTFNCIAGAQLSVQTMASRIAEAIHEFRSRNLPFAWWVGPRSGSAELRLHLLQAGLHPVEDDEGMAVDLDRVAPCVNPDGFSIRKVKSRDDLTSFASVIGSLFDPPDRAVEEVYARVSLTHIGPAAPLRLYLGSVDGVDVATSALFLGAGVAGVYSVATRSGYRGRGYGTAMTVRPLLDAREAGYRVGVLQASTDGLGIYERIGFRRFGTFEVYQ